MDTYDTAHRHPSPPRHRLGGPRIGLDWSSRARPENVPPVHMDSGMCLGRHRAFRSDTIEELIRAMAKRSPLWLRRDESGSAAVASLVLAVVMVGVLFLGMSAFLNAMPK